MIQNEKKLISSIIIGFLVLPIVVFAQEPTPDYGSHDIGVWNIMNKIITPVWQFFVGISVVMFIIAGVLFVTSSGDPGKINTAKAAAIWGVVGIIVAIVAYSIVAIVRVWVGVGV